MNPLLQLSDFGQSYWLDNLTRRMIESGELERRISQEGLRGVTSNPATFHKAVSAGNDYDRQIKDLAGRYDDPAGLYNALAASDVQMACDILRPVYDKTLRRDGYVSLEISPHLAYDTAGSIAEARRLHSLVDRPNLLIKIPGTPAGVPAIERLLIEGININITLLFGPDQYDAVARAYMSALEKRVAAGDDIAGIASVASFFLSRMDVLIDELLSHRIVPGKDSIISELATSLTGKAAIANARLAYRHFRALLDSDRWQALAQRGAPVQRMLWASTSTKNPHYDDLMYVESLIGPDTINTMPEQTVAAYLDHGDPASRITRHLDDAEHTMALLQDMAIDFDAVVSQLQNEGIQKFIEPYDATLDVLAEKHRRFRYRRNANETESLAAMAHRLRRHSLRMTSAAGSGHPTSCLSCADIVAILFFDTMRWDPSDPEARDVDTFILSKGHAAPILWAALHEAGAIHENLLSLRKIDSSLEGHPTPNNAWIRVATGSLGQGLAAANGIALANRMDGLDDARVYCLLGDGECAEGSVWEAAEFAALNGLHNLVAIIDVNGLGQSEATPYDHDTGVYARRFASFGWKTVEIDGHDIEQIQDVLARAAQGGGPTAIVASTIKGKGVSFLEGKPGKHGVSLSEEQLNTALEELGLADEHHLQVTPRHVGAEQQSRPRTANNPPDAHVRPGYSSGDRVATRDAFGRALQTLGEQIPELVVLDGDVQNSTRTEYFAAAWPGRFFQSHIAEQNMVGTALGLATAGKIPVGATFAAFLSRAYDFIRMAGHSRPRHLVLAGSHAGVSIGQDGPSQMGLEDLAEFRALAGSTVLYPSDGVSAEHLTAAALRCHGIVYLRLTRGKTPVIYAADEPFPVGGSKVLRMTDHDDITLVGAGITVHEALAAHDELKKQGVQARVIDAYSVKPVDVDTLRQAAEETGTIVVVEDHWAEGGLGEAIAAALAGAAPIIHLAVTRQPRSGDPAALMNQLGISRDSIIDRVSGIMNSGQRSVARAGQRGGT